MVRVAKILFFACMIVLPAGCDSSVSGRNKAVWQHTKITELAVSDVGRNSQDLWLKTINFDVYVFAVPLDDPNTLTDIQQQLHTRGIRFNDDEAFNDSIFSAGFGRVDAWNNIRRLLSEAGAKRIEKTSLLLSDEQANELSVAELPRQKTIFYVTSGGSTEGVTIGPGELALRIKAERTAGLRGVCKLYVEPVFTQVGKISIALLQTGKKTNEFSFSSLGFQLSMSPGGFVILWPKEYIASQPTLSSLFFSTLMPGPKPVSKTDRAVKIYLIVCTGIID